MRHLRKVLLAAVAVLALSDADAQTSVDLETARTLAFQLIADGQYDSASALARTILEGAPNDQAALLALAQAERGSGRTKSAVKAAKAAWNASETSSEKYSSSIVAAQALATDGKRLQAQLWLRRAAEHAPNDAFKARAKQDFQYVRAITPVRVNLRFSVAPSSNINNGSKNDRAVFGGLPFLLSGDAQALSGIEYRFGSDVTYTRRISDRQSLSFGVGLDTYSYSLSSSAKALAPTARNSDYAFQELRFSAKTLRGDANGKGTTGFGLTLGQNWYGGSPLTQFALAEANRQISLNKTTLLRFGLSGERQWRQDNDVRSATIWTVDTSVTKRLSRGDTIRLSGQLSDTISESNSISHQAGRLDVSYSFAKPVFGQTMLNLSLGVEKRNYDRITLPPAPRRDTKVRASATMTFNDLEYFGFAPTAKISASRNNSNVSLHETEQYGFNIGLRSSF